MGRGRRSNHWLAPDGVIREIIKLLNGSVVAASWWDLYELDPAGN